MVGIGIHITTRLLRRVVPTRVQDRHGNRNFIPHLQNCFHSLHGGSPFKVLAPQTGLLQIPILNNSLIFQRCGMSSSASSKSNADKTSEKFWPRLAKQFTKYYKMWWTICDFEGVGSKEETLSRLMKLGDEIERIQNISNERIEELRERLENLTIYENERAEWLKKCGMKKYDPINEQFDGTRHKALFGVVDPTKPLHSVAVVKKAGYMLHDQVQRLAEVGVIVAADIDELNKESQS